MAKWTLEGTGGSLRTRVTPAHTVLNQPSFEIKTRKGTDDELASRIEELARRKSTASQSTVVLDQKRGTAGLLDSSSGPARHAADHLEKVRTLIERKEFKEAMRLLGEFLRQYPGHPEGTYLQALCEHLIGRHESALETLVAVPVTGILADMQSRVRLLRGQIREKMLPEVLAQNLAFLITGRSGEAVTRLTKLVRLDPEAGLYHILLVRSHMNVRDFAQAAAAAQRAAPYCHGQEEALLADLRRELARRELENALGPARAAYRALKYRNARKEMERLRLTYGNHPLWQTFNQYLTDLGGGIFSAGRMPVDVVPKGAPENVERMHFLLIDEDIRRGKSLMGEEDFAGAESALRQGQGLTPHFPYVNFLLGVCLFKSFWADLLSGNPPDPAKATRRLEIAREFAEAGSRDPEIREGSELVSAIDGSLQMLKQVLQEMQAQRLDAAELDPLFQEFGVVMESTKDGISSIEHFRQTESRLIAVREQTTRITPRLKTEGGREQHKQFTEAIDRNLAALKKLEPEVEMAERVAAFHGELDETLSGIKDGISSLVQLRGTKTKFAALKEKVAGFRRGNRKLTGPAQQGLDQLDQAINQYQGQLDQLEAGMADSDGVHSMVDRFNKAMQGAKSSYGKMELINTMYALQAEIPEARARLRSQPAGQQLDQLESAIEAVIKQLSGSR